MSWALGMLVRCVKREPWRNSLTGEPADGPTHGWVGRVTDVEPPRGGMPGFLEVDGWPDVIFEDRYFVPILRDDQPADDAEIIALITGRPAPVPA